MEKLSELAVANQLASHLRRKHADAAYFTGLGLCVLDFKHISEQHDGLAYALETVAHEWVHSQHPRWDHRRVESWWKKEVAHRLSLLQAFARGLK